MKNWEIIDDWNTPTPETMMDPIEAAKKELAKKMKQVVLLKNYINRARNTIKTKGKDMNSAALKKKEVKIKEWQTKLEKLQNEIA